TVMAAQENKSTQDTKKNDTQNKENTSKAIDYEKAQKMSPQQLKNALTPGDLKLHNKDGERQNTEMRSFSANRAYQDVNTYIAKNIKKEKEQKMRKQKLKNEIKKRKLKIHNKNRKHKNNKIKNLTTKRTYQDVNTYIANNNIKPAKIVQDSRMNNLPKYNYKS